MASLLSKYKLTFLAAAVSLPAVLVVIFLASNLLISSVAQVRQARVVFGDLEILAGVAESPEERYRGLSGLSELCERCGLLFVFPDSHERFFVMREMNFPIDIVFIDDGQVIHVEENLPPDDPKTRESERTIYRSHGASSRVLELGAGSVARHGIKAGDKVNISIYEY